MEAERQETGAGLDLLGDLVSDSFDVRSLKDTCAALMESRANFLLVTTRRYSSCMDRVNMSLLWHLLAP